MSEVNPNGKFLMGQWPIFLNVLAAALGPLTTPSISKLPPCLLKTKYEPCAVCTDNVHMKSSA